MNSAKEPSNKSSRRRKCGFYWKCHFNEPTQSEAATKNGIRIGHSCERIKTPLNKGKTLIIISAMRRRAYFNRKHTERLHCARTLHSEMANPISRDANNGTGNFQFTNSFALNNALQFPLLVVTAEHCIYTTGIFYSGLGVWKEQFAGIIFIYSFLWQIVGIFIFTNMVRYSYRWP